MQRVNGVAQFRRRDFRGVCSLVPFKGVVDSLRFVRGVFRAGDVQAWGLGEGMTEESGRREGRGGDAGASVTSI